MNLILETKGYDPEAEVKVAATQRWVSAVNADGQYGQWALSSGVETGGSEADS